MYYLLYLLLFVLVKCDPSTSYMSARSRILEAEEKMTLGGNITLSGKESIVNDCLMKFKFDEVDYGFNNPQYFNFSHHFFLYEDRMKNSKVFKIIKDMPKGAVLHVHDMGILGPDYLVNITYMDHLYACFGAALQFRFSLNVPNVTCDGQWTLLSDARRESKDVAKFDKELRKHFSMVVQDPDAVYPTIKETWTVFMDYFFTVSSIITHRPIWEQYFYDALKMFRDDNIMYVEVRSILPTLYELDGSENNQIITVKAYRKVINRFMRDYPDFYGAKIIYAPSRKVDTNTVDNYIQFARKFKRGTPEIYAGFDLVGEEDLGEPLIKFVPQLEVSKDLNFIFHAGETNWFGTTSDENLIDAVLLGAKRIGHAYALAKHPVLMQAVKALDIGLEVNVLSNDVLSLVKDVRNHPLNIFLANGMPVIISSDDPGAWEADALSDDFYAAFVGVASKHSDLRLLKTLAINSLNYSSLDSANKSHAILDFNSRWNTFVNNFDCGLY